LLKPRIAVDPKSHAMVGRYRWRSLRRCVGLRRPLVHSEARVSVDLGLHAVLRRGRGRSL
jgi:hypothetical protein